jgi:hypothetical protein
MCNILVVLASLNLYALPLEVLYSVWPEASKANDSVNTLPLFYF